MVTSETDRIAYVDGQQFVACKSELLLSFLVGSFLLNCFLLKRKMSITRKTQMMKYDPTIVVRIQSNDGRKIDRLETRIDPMSPP
jgi:hypothetical protein